MGKAAGRFGKISAYSIPAGETRFYVVDLVPTGYIVVAADDELEPIIAFSHEGQFAAQAGSPLCDLLQKDTEGRMLHLHGAPTANQTKPAVSAKAKAKWQLLASPATRAAAVSPAGIIPDFLPPVAAPDYVRVYPLIQSQWDQSTISDGVSQIAVYNYYTPPNPPGDPNNYLCGCVATAWAQIMRFHQWPATGVGTGSFAITVDGASRQAAPRGGDGAGGPYDWADMTLIPDASITQTQCQAIGALLYDAGVANNMDYAQSGSGAYLQSAKIKNVFHYADGVLSTSDLADIALAIRTNLDAGLPVALSVLSTQQWTSHELICDGYAYNLGTLYDHLNMGWGGEDDTWYNLPEIGTHYDYDTVTGCTYNIDPTVAGEIISGRITDLYGHPVSGILVTVAGPSTYTATTNQCGIFAFKGLASNTTWTVSNNGGSSVFGPAQATVTTGCSTDNSAVGNRIIDDFQVPALGITTEPANQGVTAGSNAIFIAAASGTPTPTLQWQVSTDGGGTWTNLSDTAPYSGSSTGMLNITAVAAAMNGYQYRCLASNSIQGSVASNAATLTIITPGSLWGVGDNDNGQLDRSFRMEPAPELILSGGVQTVAAGGYHSLILKTDGSLWAIGDNTYGQLGNGTTAQPRAPMLILPSGVKAVAAGGYYSLILKTDGSLWAMGANDYGQLGDGTTTQQLAPELILSGGVQAIAAGDDFSLVVKTDGSLWAMGDNRHGQLGNGTTTPQLAPELVLSGGVKAVAAGFYHSLILKTDGSLWAMGENTYGQLGDGTTTEHNSPVQILPGGVQAVAAGGYHSLIMKTDGSLWATGCNSDGQLGDGTVIGHTTPELIAANVETMSAEVYDSLFVGGGDIYTVPQFTVQPVGQTVAVGDSTSFTVSVLCNPAPSCRWQVSTNGGNTWNGLAETAPYSGTSTGTLTIAAVTAAMNGSQFQCLASNSAQSNVASNAAILTVTVLSAATANPAEAVISSGFAISWSSVPGATGYRLDVSTDTLFSSFVSGYQNLDVGDVAGATLSGLSADTTYYCRVRAYDSQGIGANSSTMMVTTTAPIVVTTPLIVTTLAGLPLSSGSNDGTGGSARFCYPSGIAADNAGNLYLADTDNHTIRKIIVSTGVVTTLAGLAGNPGSADGTGSAARFNSPSGVAVDRAGTVYVADTKNNTLRMVSASGAVSTLAGSPRTAGSVDGTGTAALFYGPQGLAIDSSNNLYVADTNNHTIRKVVPSTGAVTTVAGLAGNPGSAGGMVDLAQFNYPSGVAVDSAGNLYVADTENHTIRMISVVGPIVSPLGTPGSTVVSTLAGLAGNSGGADGRGSAARFDSPSDLAVDSSGNLYVADTDNFTIREIVPSTGVVTTGVVTTLAGLAETSGSADGLGSGARFFHPAGIAIDGNSNLYIADTDNDTVRLGLLARAPAIQTQPQSQTVSAGSSVQFSVTASGRPAVIYQWNFNGTAINGATNSSYSLSNAQSGNAGNYTVVVSNVMGAVSSNPATLTVNAVNPPPSGGSSGGGGGGGALSDWFCGALLLLAAVRASSRAIFNPTRYSAGVTR